jgi:hypothetical protein
LHELIGPLEQRFAQLDGSRDGRPVDEHARGVDRLTRFAIHDAPAADGVEVLEREAERIDDAVARVARRVRTVRLEPRAHGARLLPFDDLDERLDVGRRRLGRRTEHVLEQPLAAQHRGSSIRVRGHEQHATLAE